MKGGQAILPVAVRAYTTPRLGGKAMRKRSRGISLPTTVLVIDTETTADKTQRLTFGSWRMYDDGQLVDEGLFYGDDLPADDRTVLIEYIRAHAAEGLRLLSRREFLREVFWKLAYKARALIVGFNLPFDLSRLACDWGEARAAYYTGGFSHILWDYERDGVRRESRYRPRLAIKSIDSKRALTGFLRRRAPDAADLIPEQGADGKPDPKYAFPGHFLDLRTLAFALTNEGHSLKSACRAFGVEHGKAETAGHGLVTPEYIDYNRRDVLASWELFVKLREEYARHPIDLQMTKAFSPAALGKAYLEALGVEPILTRQPDFPKDALGHAMATYYGGRTEARLRCEPVPVVYLDFLSMYPTVNGLMGLWKLLTAERIEVVDATDEVHELLASITLDDCFDPASWRRFVGLVRLAPEGDILPTRARYGNEASWQIGVNPLTASEPLWYTIADAVAATLLTGKPPRVLEAIRFVHRGTIPTLRAVELRGQVRVDPRTTDFFRTVIEERKRLATRGGLPSKERKRLDQFLKVLANATSYGIFAEMNRQELPSGEKTPVEVWGIDDTPFTAMVAAPEGPGAHCFPPLAAWIAGAERLMLALLERCVTDAGGTYAMCDTDSMAIVATERGGLVPCPGGSERMPDVRGAVRALSWAEVAAIQQRFAALNPYDRDVVPGSVLKIEDENFDAGRQRVVWCYAISAKRYALFTLDEQGRPVLLKWSEHGLGHLLNPTDPDDDDRNWIRVVWEGLVTEALGQPYAWPTWLGQPAIGRITASNPALLRPFAQLNQGKPYAEQIKPYNFLLSAQVAPFGHPEGADPRHFHLVAP
ncbi:MAG: DNA polymerase [Chloroflexota bacterium]|nr:DNA polymerase [Chloroflexota bacterium]